MPQWFLSVCLALLALGHLATSKVSRPLSGPVDEAHIPEYYGADNRPNIVFFFTDDQDLHMNSLDYLPNIRKHLLDRGTLYKRHFCTTALCCPARVSVLTGKLAHNTNVTDVNPPYGGYPQFINQGLNENYLPIWLSEADYNVYYTGKLFNAHNITNYNKPFAAGFKGSDFILDPFTYVYLNATYQRNKEPPKSYEGSHTVDVLAEKSLALLDEAVSDGKPFFLGIAPVAPHSNVIIQSLDGPPEDYKVSFSPPIPADRHKNLFPDAKVPRTPNFNPESPSGANWISRLPRQNEKNIVSNDEHFRARLQALQSVDELVDSIFKRLEHHGVLDNTYIFYTTDNGYHIGQHRLQPGKETGFEEDINIPLIVRGPGVPENKVTEIITTHTDLAPTWLKIAGAPLREDFDGEAIPLTEKEIAAAAKTRQEHVNVEYWGLAVVEGKHWEGPSPLIRNNTYKALRVIGEEYNLYYSVWCTNEHELYDMKTDPGQLNNLLPKSSSRIYKLMGHPIPKLMARLDALLLVLKSCKGAACLLPWRELHPAGNVENLKDALSPLYDDFYENYPKRVGYTRCEEGYIIDAEGPQFERDPLVHRHGAAWHEWV